jgi:uncharacterized protein (DUF305 family)
MPLSRSSLLLALALAVACAPATATRPLTPADVVRRDGGIAPYVQADVDFMTGMIAHHAQAVVMARFAPTHGASRAVQEFAARIAVAQTDEIAFMKSWLRARNQPIPADDAHLHVGHASEHAAMGMNGMLTPAQMTELDAARGPMFDRLFLTFMIQHHEGAVAMVETLMAVDGAVRDEDIYKFAADVSADQVTEIDRMRVMLAAMPPAAPTPQ